MEFNEKLQELRKSRSLTQEQLAQALFVSRTAVSKWESGRGYPSIDSLKQISRYFSVTIDELICPDEIILAAEEERRDTAGKYLALLCAVLDLLPVVVLFLPIFGNGTDSPTAVTLPALTGVQPWLKAVFGAVPGLTALNGLCGLILTGFDQPVWNRHRLVTGLALSVTGVAVFLLTRQPYAGIVYLALLVIKGFFVLKTK